MDTNISQLIGKTITEINKTDEEIIFSCNDGSVYRMYHSQDCCESVSIDDIVGELNDLIGSPILKASEDVDSNNPKTETYGEGENAFKSTDESATWTFYNISTIKGHVTIKWYGSSNGYYSESVDFVKLQPES